MAASRDIFITGIAYELGEQEHDLDELTAVVPGVRQSLREGGLSTYRTTERSVVELTAGPIRRTLDALDDADRGAIRRLIFATNSVWDESLHTPAAVSGLLNKLDLPGVLPLGASLSWCANFHAALELARLLIEADGEECVLVACADKWPVERVDRLVSPKVSVHTDAAASFAVTTRGGPFQVRATRIRLDPALGTVDRNREFVRYMDGVARGVTGIVNDALGAVGLEPDAVARVVPNNYNRWTSRSMGQLAGFEEPQLYLDNVPRFAHALCADNPINLCDLASNGGVRRGDRLLLLGTGPYQWGASVVDAATGA